MQSTVVQTSEYDAGLRSFLLSVYNRMGLSLLLTGLMAWVASHDPVAHYLFRQTAKGLDYTLLGFAVAFGPIFLLLTLGIARRLTSKTGSAVALWGTSALFGLSFGAIFLRYTGMTIAITFAEAATAFGGMSLFGYMTKRDLSGFGSFLMIGLFGIIIAMLVNAFLIQSTLMHMMISVVGILIFAGFTAYDTQKLKSDYEWDNDSADTLTTKANLAALNLYLDFINLFMFILQLNSSKD